MSAPKHVVVIGAGVVGLCCAHYLLERGHSVTLLERDSEPLTGCSMGNAGMIVPSHFEPLAAPGAVSMGLRMMLQRDGPFGIRARFDADLLSWLMQFRKCATAQHVARTSPLLLRLHLESRKCYEELAEQGAEFGLVTRGLLMLCKETSTLNQEAHLAERAKALGLAAEVLDPAGTARVDPSVRMSVAGSVFFPQDCHFSPHRFMACLLERVRAAGARIEWNSPVIGWRSRGMGMEAQEGSNKPSWVNGRANAVKTPNGEIEADEFVVACGSWSSEILRTLDIPLALQPGKGYSVTLLNPDPLPTVCSILVEARTAVTPMDGGLRIAGTMELGGQDHRINQPRLNGMLEAFPTYFPDYAGTDVTQLPVWTGLRPCSPDGLPYVGRDKVRPNVITATGHAMMGMSLGPITGKLVAGIVSGDEPDGALEALCPYRFLRR